jgi:hypothetical protein
VIAATSAWTIVPIVVGAVTAIGTAAAGVVTWFISGVRAERTRLQKLYADAYSAVMSYQECPYVIRRRRAPAPGDDQIAGEERLRISSVLHPVQEAINNYSAQISIESTAVSASYDALVRKTREVAGGYMHDAWEDEPLDNDSGMNIRLDYGALVEPRNEYLASVKADMTFWRVAFPRLRKPTT